MTCEMAKSDRGVMLQHCDSMCMCDSTKHHRSYACITVLPQCITTHLHTTLVYDRSSGQAGYKEAGDGKKIQPPPGFEPGISCLLDRRFNQLSHGGS